jgi:putative methanogenesis marker 16 metalloprotein
MSKTRTFEEINNKIASKKAVVMTVQEFIEKIADGEKIEFDDVDVITTATKGLMSGIAGVFSFRLAEPRIHRKFKAVSLNGIPGYVGPCPNEFLGVIDLVLYGTAQSETRNNYAGGTLFRELVEEKPIEIVAKTDDGVQIEKTITIYDMQFARLMGTRQAIRNYSSIINTSTKSITTIFSALPFAPDTSQLTFSGCGALNPLQNDPLFEIAGVGTPVLVNGSVGHIIGPGTRNNIEKPNLMCIADFKGMKPEYMGSFMTSFGLEPICSIAMAIPIINEGVFNNIVKADKEVKLQILDLVGRAKIGEITYGDVWDNNFLIKFDPKKCKSHEDCPVQAGCPTKAYEVGKGIDRTRCFNCGACLRLCREGCFNGDLKKIDYHGTEVPVVLRQSDRFNAIKLATELKNMVINGEFPIKERITKLNFYEFVI